MEVFQISENVNMPTENLTYLPFSEINLLKDVRIISMKEV